MNNATLIYNLNRSEIVERYVWDTRYGTDRGTNRRYRYSLGIKPTYPRFATHSIYQRTQLRPVAGETLAAHSGPPLLPTSAPKTLVTPLCVLQPDNILQNMN